jgi:hypothetical protein
MTTDILSRIIDHKVASYLVKSTISHSHQELPPFHDRCDVQDFASSDSANGSVDMYTMLMTANGDDNDQGTHVELDASMH